MTIEIAIIIIGTHFREQTVEIASLITADRSQTLEIAGHQTATRIDETTVGSAIKRTLDHTHENEEIKGIDATTSRRETTAGSAVSLTVGTRQDSIVGIEVPAIEGRLRDTTAEIEVRTIGARTEVRTVMIADHRTDDHQSDRAAEIATPREGSDPTIESGDRQNGTEAGSHAATIAAIGETFRKIGKEAQLQRRRKPTS